MYWWKVKENNLVEKESWFGSINFLIGFLCFKGDSCEIFKGF